MEVRLIQRFRRHRLGVLALLFLAYVGYYFCRISLVVAKPTLETELGLSKAETGQILSWYFGVYAISKLLTGFLGDRVGGKAMLLFGVLGTVACNVAFGFGRELTTFVVVWSANAFFQAVGWPAMMSCMSQWYPSRESGRAIGVLSLSYSLVGDALARVSGGALLGAFVLTEGHLWDEMFFTHAAILLAIGVVVWLALEPRPEAGGLPDVDAYEKAAHVEVETTADAGREADLVASARTPYGRQLVRILLSRWFWLACALYLLLSTLRYVFFSWSIEYVKDTTKMTTGAAAITSAVYPVFGGVGILVTGWVSDRMGARRGPIIVVMCALLVPAIYAFSLVPQGSPVLLVAGLGLIGFLLYGPYALMAGAMAIDFGSRHSAASAAGIIDAVGAIGAILAGAGMGALIDGVGWEGAFGIVTGVAGFAALLSITMWNFKPLTPCPPNTPTARAL